MLYIRTEDMPKLQALFVPSNAERSTQVSSAVLNLLTVTGKMTKEELLDNVLLMILRKNKIYYEVTPNSQLTECDPDAFKVVITRAVEEKLKSLITDNKIKKIDEETYQYNMQSSALTLQEEASQTNAQERQQEASQTNAQERQPTPAPSDETIPSQPISTPQTKPRKRNVASKDSIYVESQEKAKQLGEGVKHNIISQHEQLVDTLFSYNGSSFSITDLTYRIANNIANGFTLPEDNKTITISIMPSRTDDHKIGVNEAFSSGVISYVGIKFCTNTMETVLVKEKSITNSVNYYRLSKNVTRLDLLSAIESVFHDSSRRRNTQGPLTTANIKQEVANATMENRYGKYILTSQLPKFSELTTEKKIREYLDLELHKIPNILSAFTLTSHYLSYLKSNKDLNMYSRKKNNDYSSIEIATRSIHKIMFDILQTEFKMDKLLKFNNKEAYLSRENNANDNQTLVDEYNGKQTRAITNQQPVATTPVTCPPQSGSALVDAQDQQMPQRQETSLSVATPCNSTTTTTTTTTRSSHLLPKERVEYSDSSFIMEVPETRISEAPQVVLSQKGDNQSELASDQREFASILAGFGLLSPRNKTKDRTTDDLQRTDDLQNLAQAADEIDLNTADEEQMEEERAVEMLTISKKRSADLEVEEILESSNAKRTKTKGKKTSSGKKTSAKGTSGRGRGRGRGRR